MTHLESSVAKIEWNESAQAVEIIYKVRQQSGDLKCLLDYRATIRNEFRTALNISADIAEARQTENWIGGMSEFLLFTGEDEAWSLSEWFPRLKAAGVLNMAIVPPQTLIGKLTLEALAQRVEGIAIRQVRSLEEAYTWLDEQSN
jgi:hypothetical protein